MPLRPLDEEFARDPRRRDAPELRSKRAKHTRSEELTVRVDAREGVRDDAREDSRARGS
ncbi:MAG TPA: hypothetical protein VGD27_01305 [Longimicrobiales bacterium]